MIPVELDKAKWTAQELAQFQQRGWRDRRVGEFPPVMATVRPADYVDDFNRGTVEFDAGWKNYCFHQVTFAPGDTPVECNFSQAAPDTPVATPATRVAIADCNMTNCAAHAKLDVQRSNRAQAWFIKDPVLNVITGVQAITDSPDKLTGLEIAPANAVKVEIAAAVADEEAIP